MLTGFRVLWRALVHFWDESLLMMRTNVFWFVASLPLYLVTVLVCGLFVPPITGEGEGSFLPWVMAAFVIVVIPQPISAGAYAIADHVANDETPEFSIFWRAIRMLWKRTLLMYVIGAAVFGGLLFNTSFYMQVSTGLLQAVAILWFYAIIYWLTMQAYLLPLLVHAAIPPPPPTSGDDGWPIDETTGRRTVNPPSPPPVPEIIPLRTLYKRAAVLALANPLMSLVLLLGSLLALTLSSFALPVYPLIVMSFVALVNCRGLRALREKYFPTEAQGAAR
jgi:uncharacterized membrane protein YesL